MTAPEPGTQIPSGSVIITPEDMWRAIEETRDSSRRTETSVAELKLLVNPALKEVRDDLAHLDDREAKHQEEHELRIRELENQSAASRWVPAIVMSVLVGAIVSVVGYVLSNLTP